MAVVLEVEGFLIGFFFQINFIGSDRETLDNKRSDKTKILLDLGVDSSWKRETVLPLWWVDVMASEH